MTSGGEACRAPPTTPAPAAATPYTPAPPSTTLLPRPGPAKEGDGRADPTAAGVTPGAAAAPAGAGAAERTAEADTVGGGRRPEGASPDEDEEKEEAIGAAFAAGERPSRRARSPAGVENSVLAAADAAASGTTGALTASVELSDSVWSVDSAGASTVPPRAVVTGAADATPIVSENRPGDAASSRRNPS